MSMTTDFELSRKYFFYHKDGLLDIFIGLGILMAGAALWAEMVWMVGSWIAIFVPLWISGRKSITYPRGQDIVIYPEIKFRFSLAMAGILGIFLFGAVAAIGGSLGFELLPTFRDFISNNINLLIGFGMSGFLILSALFMRVPRLAGYSILTIIAFVIGQILGWQFWISMVITGSLMAISGTMILMRFIKEHPVYE